MVWSLGQLNGPIPDCAMPQPERSAWWYRSSAGAVNLMLAFSNTGFQVSLSDCRVLQASVAYWSCVHSSCTLLGLAGAAGPACSVPAIEPSICEGSIPNTSAPISAITIAPQPS